MTRQYFTSEMEYTNFEPNLEGKPSGRKRYFVAFDFVVFVFFPILLEQQQMWQNRQHGGTLKSKSTK